MSLIAYTPWSTDRRVFVDHAASFNDEELGVYEVQVVTLTRLEWYRRAVNLLRGYPSHPWPGDVQRELGFKLGNEIREALEQTTDDEVALVLDWDSAMLVHAAAL